MFYAKNVPGWERAIRIVFGAVIVALALTLLKGIVGVVVAIAALGVVFSGLIGFCPACALVGRRLDKQMKR
jgi:hypothetical protein